MRIGIDIDDTTFSTMEQMIKYADIFEFEIKGKKRKKKSFGLIKNRYYLKELYGWDTKTKQAFFDKYYQNILKECKILPNVSEVIEKLKNDGHIIQFVTARLMNIRECDTKKITIDSLEKNHVYYDELFLNISDKVSFFKENHLDLCIEDSYETCKEMQKNGIKAILMTTKLNQKIVDEDVIRANDWLEIYEIIKENFKE